MDPRPLPATVIAIKARARQRDGIAASTACRGGIVAFGATSLLLTALAFSVPPPSRNLLSGELRANLLREIHREVKQAGVRPNFAAAEGVHRVTGREMQGHPLDVAAGRDTQKLWDSESKESKLKRYIDQQQQVLSSIEGQPAIEISKPQHAVHMFKYDARNSEDHNIFADIDEHGDDDPDAFGSENGNGGDAAARAWHMVPPSSDLSRIERHQRSSGSDRWSGEEGALAALQAKAEARLKKDNLAHQDEEGVAIKGNMSVVVDDAGEHVPADSVAAVASAVCYICLSCKACDQAAHFDDTTRTDGVQISQGISQG